MNPEDDPRWEDPAWYYYPKGEGSWHWIGDYDPNDPRNEDEDWVYIPELGGWLWLGEDDPPEQYQDKSSGLRQSLFNSKYDLFLVACIVGIALFCMVLILAA